MGGLPDSANQFSSRAKSARRRFTDQIITLLNTANANITEESNLEDSMIAAQDLLIQANADLRAQILALAVPPETAQQITDLFAAQAAALEANKAKLVAAQMKNTPVDPVVVDPDAPVDPNVVSRRR